MVKLTDLVRLDCIRVPLQSTAKRAVIEELVDMLALAGLVGDKASVVSAVWTRECTKTTGIGQGLAIPHGKSPAMTGLALAIGKPEQPIDFEAIDDRPVRLVVLLASPPERTGDHIQALAAISRMMTVADLRERIYEADSAEAVYELIRANSP